jgi:hypothetical protein
VIGGGSIDRESIAKTAAQRLWVEKKKSHQPQEFTSRRNKRSTADCGRRFAATL